MYHVHELRIPWILFLLQKKFLCYDIGIKITIKKIRKMTSMSSSSNNISFPSKDKVDGEMVS